MSKVTNRARPNKHLRGHKMFGILKSNGIDPNTAMHMLIDAEVDSTSPDCDSIGGYCVWSHTKYSKLWCRAYKADIAKETKY